jgi:hypothetical protein
MDSAGVTLVGNGPTERVLDWTFEPILTLGGMDEGPTAFFRVFPSSVGTDTIGNLYVLDAGNFSIAVFDRSGQHVLSYGQQGEGPGELGFPSDLAVGAGGETAVHDFARRALVRFDAEGTFTGTVPLPGPLQRQVVLLEDGRVAAAVTQQIAVDSADFRLLSFFGNDTLEIASVRQFTRPEPRQFYCGLIARPPYFGPRVVWAAAGNRLVFSDDARYHLRVVDHDSLTGVWTRDLPPVRSTPELATWEVAQGDSLRTPGCVVPADEAATKFGYADTAPTIHSLAVDPDGAVWVRRRTDVPGKLVIDVLNATGGYVGTLPDGTPFPALFRGTDEIIRVERDEYDRPLVIVSRIDRG